MQKTENKGKWTDITAPISHGMVTWPGQIPVEVTKLKSIGQNGSKANVTAISMSAHTGTHMDAPLHFMADGDDIMRTDIDALIGHAKVFHIKDSSEISYREIKDFPIEQGDRILFKTRNSDVDWETSHFMEDYVYLSADAARYLVEKEVRTVGVDYLSVGSMADGEEVHKILLGAPVHVIEGLKLANIAPGDYEMICLPMKIKGGDGAPARVVIKPYNKQAS